LEVVVDIKVKSHMMRAGKSARELVAQHVRELIASKGLECGAALPTYQEFCAELGLSYLTIKRGMDLLEAEGLVRRIPSKGTFVTKAIHRQARPLHGMLMVFRASIMRAFVDSYLVEIARSALTEIDSTGASARLVSIQGDGLLFADHITSGVNGLLLVGVENAPYLRLVSNWGIPAVALDYCSDTVPMDFVACDNRAATRCAVDRLLQLGHRRLAYVGERETSKVSPNRRKDEVLELESSDFRERREGVADALKASGLQPVATIVANPTGEGRGMIDADEAVARLLAPGAGTPTAVLASSDGLAVRLIDALARCGKRVPQDVSVCAVAGASAPAGHPGLTYCRFDFAAMGRKGVELLQERCGTVTKPVNRIHRIGFEWVEGRTCGARA
jgi:DNA-binding LacI/PurR family transcriptional regulator